MHICDVLFGVEMLKKLLMYRQTSNIRRTLEGNKIYDHSDIVGASLVGAVPTTCEQMSFIFY